MALCPPSGVRERFVGGDAASDWVPAQLPREGNAASDWVPAQPRAGASLARGGVRLQHLVLSSLGQTCRWW